MLFFAFMALFAFFGRSYALSLLYPTSLLAGANYSIQWNGQPGYLFTVEQFNPNMTLQTLMTDNNITYWLVDVPEGTQIAFTIQDAFESSPLTGDTLTVEPNPLLSASISLASVSSVSLLASATSTFPPASQVSSTTGTSTQPSASLSSSGSLSPTTSPIRNTHHNNDVGPIAGGILGSLALIALVAFVFWWLRQRHAKRNHRQLLPESESFGQVRYTSVATVEGNNSSTTQAPDMQRSVESTAREQRIYPAMVTQPNLVPRSMIGPYAGLPEP